VRDLYLIFLFEKILHVKQNVSDTLKIVTNRNYIVLKKMILQIITQAVSYMSRNFLFSYGQQMHQINNRNR
jgi:hypothetical protein